MKENQFTLQPYENAGGGMSWRVTGWLGGVRIRKNFKLREEAAAEKATLQIRAAQIAGGMRTAITTLSDAELRDAEIAVRRITGLPRPLSFYVDYALANYREPQEQKKLSEAIAEYVAAKQHEHEQDFLSITQTQRIRRDLERLRKAFPDARMSELTGPRLVAYFEAGQATLKTFNNRRGIVSTFMKYAFQKGWVAENPLARVPARRIRYRRSGATTLSAEAAREMMQALETFEDARWVPFVALALFAGIRPNVPHGEIARLQPDAINLETGTISISAEVSKIREPRKITIQPNLVSWLRAYPVAKYPLTLTDFHRRHARMAKKFGLSHDVLRHTFISMFVAKFRSLGEAALQAGNSEAIIRKHYLDLKTKQEADEFFAIMPKLKSPPSAETAAFPIAEAAAEMRLAS